MKRENKKQRKNQKGFTLVEMIVVIAIIGVLATMMVPSLIGYVDKAHTSNNITAATHVGRMAQTVLIELSADASISGKFEGAGTGTGSELVIDVAKDEPTATDGDTAFMTSFNNLMSGNKFVGNVEIKIAGGKLTEVRYSKLSFDAVTATESDKTVGYYKP